MKNILSIDVSTQDTTASVYDVNGRKITESSKPHHTYGEGVISEQDPNEWWKNLKETVKTAIADESIRADIIAIVANGTPYGVIPVDKDGKPLMHAITYVDKRATEEAKTISQMPEFKEAAKTSGQHANPTHPIPKILWIKDNKPEIYERTRIFHTPTSYLNYKLTGQIFTDVWENVRKYSDPQTGELPKPLLKALGIDSDKFPPAYPIGSRTYDLREELTQELNLPPTAKVILATNDSGLATIGSGISKPGDTHISCGSATVLKTLTTKRLQDPEGTVYPQPALQVGLWYLSGYEMSGAVLEWYKNRYIEPEGYETMEEEAKTTPPGANGVIFKPYLYGSRCPENDPNAKAKFINTTPTTPSADLTRAVYESIAYIAKDIIIRFEETGAKVADLYMSGGLSRSPTINQITADATNRKIHLLKEKDTTSTGATIIATTALGIYPTIEEASKSIIKIEKTIKPKNHKTYEKLYIKWKKAK